MTWWLRYCANNDETDNDRLFKFTNFMLLHVLDANWPCDLWTFYWQHLRNFTVIFNGNQLVDIVHLQYKYFMEIYCAKYIVHLLSNYNIVVLYRCKCIVEMYHTITMYCANVFDKHTNAKMYNTLFACIIQPYHMNVLQKTLSFNSKPILQLTYKYSVQNICT